MQSPSASFSPSTTRPPVLRLPDLVLWGCYALVLVMLVLAFAIRGLGDSALIASSGMVYGLCTAGGAYLILVTVRCLPPGRVRQSYRWFLLALVAVVVRSALLAGSTALGLDLSTPFIRWPSLALYGAMYACVLMAGASFVPQRSTLIGTIPRVVIGSVLCGVAVLVLLTSVPGVGVPLLQLIRGTALAPVGTTAGITAAICFAVAVIGLRYGRRGGPAVVLTIVATLCFLVGTLLLTSIRVIAPEQAVGAYWLNPLYVLPNILIPHGIYRSIERPPQFTPPAKGQPSSDWLFWGLVPRVVAISAVLVALISGQVLTTWLLVLGGVWIAHELLALRDHWRIARQLARARRSGDG